MHFTSINKAELRGAIANYSMDTHEPRSSWAITQRYRFKPYVFTKYNFINNTNDDISAWDVVSCDKYVCLV